MIMIEQIRTSEKGTSDNWIEYCKIILFIYAWKIINHYKES